MNNTFQAKHIEKLRLIKKSAISISNALGGICLIAISLLTHGSEAYSHSGMVDSRGGHNCYVGSCAGTYHFHGKSSQEAANGWIVIALIVGGIGYLAYRGKTSAQSSSSTKNTRSNQEAENREKIVSSSKNEQRLIFTKNFTMPILVELNSASRKVTQNRVSAAFDRWLIGYFSGFLLYQSNPKEPLAILDVGMWSRQAGWDRLSKDVALLIDALIAQDQNLKIMNIEKLKACLSEYLLSDKNWIIGARDGIFQAKDWNAVGSISPIIEKRWSELS